jgi:hypothetical protein
MESNSINYLLKFRKDYQNKLEEIGSSTNLLERDRLIKSETERMLLNVENKLKDAN